MPLSRRPSAIAARIAIAAALILAGSQPVVPQARGPGSRALIDGGQITVIVPQFVVHALWFKSNDETNWKYNGSDEVYAVFSDMDPTHSDRVTSVYGNVDEGDTRNFLAADKCMAPQSKCDRGMADLNVRFAFWERDDMPLRLGEFCPGDFAGSHYRLEGGMCTSDDLIGRGEIIHSRDDLRAMLPSVGTSREFTHVMDKDAGKYRVRYRITRLADVDRSIVIHLPPDLGLPPSITLQASVTNSVLTLSWSGATTSTVDIYRNGMLIVTTQNDGNHLMEPPASGTYQFRLCNLGSTTACSPQVQLVVP